MSYDRNDYADTSCPDAPVPHLLILRCEQHKEVYLKQSRHSSIGNLLKLSIGSIQEGVTGRRSRVARNFLSKFEEKVTSLER
jgi:hypothetical protein